VAVQENAEKNVGGTIDKIYRKLRGICTELGMEDRIKRVVTKEAFINLNGHKEAFA